RLDLYDVDVRLRFDRAGKLLTVIRPKKGGGPLPSIRVRNGRLTIDQEGREPFTLEGVSLTLLPAKRYQLLGVVDDPTWGPIDVTGSLDQRTMATEIHLSHPGLEVTPAGLASVPFVAPKT